MIIRVRRMTAIMRVFHWLLALSVVSCFITGLFIAAPFWWTSPAGPGVTDRYLMGMVRFIHFGFAMTLDVAFLVWFYLFFFSLETPFVKSLLPLGLRFREAVAMLAHYFTLKKKPPTIGDRHVDPLNAYGFLLIHFFVLVQMLTGFALMAPTFSAANSYLPIWPAILKASETFCVGIFGSVVALRQAHHLTGYVIISLAMIHVYIQVWREVFWTEGHMSVVFSGYKYIQTDE